MNKIIKKALELAEKGVELPILEIGEVVTLEEVWDGEGSVPFLDGNSGTFCYYINDYYNIDYSFNIIEYNGEETLSSVVQITEIEIV